VCRDAIGCDWSIGLVGFEEIVAIEAATTVVADTPPRGVGGWSVRDLIGAESLAVGTEVKRSTGVLRAPVVNLIRRRVGRRVNVDDVVRVRGPMPPGSFLGLTLRKLPFGALVGVAPVAVAAVGDVWELVNVPAVGDEVAGLEVVVKPCGEATVDRAVALALAVDGLVEAPPTVPAVPIPIDEAAVRCIGSTADLCIVTLRTDRNLVAHASSPSCSS
jgi:hypothetical protein